jgi:gluconate 2-dehydrogenase gamma chain
MPVSRRGFMAEVVWSSMGASLVLLVGCRARNALDDKAAPAESTAPRFFTAVELAALAAASERILPRDEDPGAVDLGVPEYIDRMLTDDVMKNWREPMRRGLALLDERAQAKLAAPFAQAPADAQDEILAAIERETRGPTGFFARLSHLTLEGAFGDPVHGGNRDGAGWRLVGFRADPCGPAGLARLRRP